MKELLVEAGQLIRPRRCSASDRAAAFYRRWGFIDVPENPGRLFRRLAEIRRSLDDA